MKKVLLTILAGALLHPVAFPERAYACSCFYVEDEQQRNISYYDNADLIVQGVPIESAIDSDSNIHYSIAVEKVWKGQTDAVVDIQTAPDSAMCGIMLELDEPVIIFARENNGQFETGLCSGTAVASADMATWLSAYENDPEEIDCSPYICENGDTFPRCEGENVISYLVDPCQFSEGETEEEEERGFIDVPTTHPQYKSILFVKDEGIVSGYEDGSYLPDQFINRAEFTKIIVASNFRSEAIASCAAESMFTDVLNSDWFASYVCTAKIDGIIDGYEDGSFKPNALVNFAEAAKIVVNAFGIETNPEDHLSVWWKPYVFALARIGGLPVSFSDPNQQLTRGDMAEIIYRVMMGMQG